MSIPMSLYTLPSMPDDILLEIMNCLDVKEIYCVRKTCKTIYTVTKYKDLWLVIMLEGISTGTLALPAYCRPFSALSAGEMEALTVHSLRVRHALNSSSPPAAIVRMHRRRSVTWVRLVHGQWLLVASSDSSTSVLSLWSLDCIFAQKDRESAPAADAEGFLGGPVGGGEVEIQNGLFFIALDIQSPEPFICVVTASKVPGGDMLVFSELGRFPSISRIRALRGSFIGAACTRNLNITCVLNWKTGSVIQLSDAPDPEGGCIAMAMYQDLVVIATPTKLELRTLLYNPLRWSKCTQPLNFAQRQAAYASVAIESHVERPSVREGDSAHPLCIRLCLGYDARLSVLDIVLLPGDDAIVSQEVWSYSPGSHMDAVHPVFGQRMTALSWLNAPQDDFVSVAFMTSRLPPFGDLLGSDERSRQLPVFQLIDPEIPALYCMGVRDFDETRGLVVLGTAYGELNVYNLINSGHHKLDDCFEAILFPALSNVGLSLSNRTACRPALPFPYSGPLLAGAEIREHLVSSWVPSQPADVPEGWYNHFIAGSGDARESGLWSEYGKTVNEKAWQVEHGLHIYGSVIPLMWHDDLGIVIFRVGGLLVVEFEEPEKCGFYIMHTHVTLQQAADAAVLDDMSHVSTSKRLMPRGPFNESMRFKWMWVGEWIHGRNRWQELLDRGGTVDSSWTDPSNKPGPPIQGAKYTPVGPRWAWASLDKYLIRGKTFDLND